MSNIIKEPPQEYFGGGWTDLKLKVLEKYLSAYTKVFANKRSYFRLAYIDAFAGTGSLNKKKKDNKQELLFEFSENIEAKEKASLRGSTKIALESEPFFDKYIFIEQDKKRVVELKKMVYEEFPHLKEKVSIQNEEANETLKNLCDKEWKKHRAVVFLDPFGMEVEWQTITAIARTKAIDLWILFPLGVGVNRMLMRNREDIPPKWSDILDKIFGTTEWSNEFYKTENTLSLLNEDNQETKKVANFTKIAKFYIKRLNIIFAKVVEEPFFLYNSKNNPIYLFCFAASNPKAAKTAKKIAKDIISKYKK